jgi:hypothetical protein
MARPLKLETAGAIYHVTSRVDRREPIYDEDEGRSQWLNILSNLVIGRVHLEGHK